MAVATGPRAAPRPFLLAHVSSYAKSSGDNRLSSTLWATLALVAARDAGFTVKPDALKYRDPGCNERGTATLRHASSTNTTMNNPLAPAIPLLALLVLSSITPSQGLVTPVGSSGA